MRLSNFSLLKDHDIGKLIEPFFSLETIFLPFPSTNKNISEITLKDYFRFVFTLGLSLKISDGAYLDFMFHTGGINVPIKLDSINTFRLQLDISTNL